MFLKCNLSNFKKQTFGRGSFKSSFGKSNKIQSAYPAYMYYINNYISNYI